MNHVPLRQFPGRASLEVWNRASGGVAAAQRPLVVIVDDDLDVRTALAELLLSVGMEAEAFASSRDWLESGLTERPGCLILDVRMPGSSGLDLQHHLARNGDAKPII